MSTFKIEGLPPTTNKGFRVGQGRFYLTEEYKAFMFRARGVVPRTVECINKPEKVSLYVTFYYVYDRDLDSGLKCLLDGLQGRCYENDMQIVELQVTKQKVSADPYTMVQVDKYHNG